MHYISGDNQGNYREEINPIYPGQGAYHGYQSFYPRENP